MNKDIAGNITSLVNGFEVIVAAVANELNATNTVTLSIVRWIFSMNPVTTYTEYRSKLLRSLPAFEEFMIY